MYRYVPVDLLWSANNQCPDQPRIDPYQLAAMFAFKHESNEFLRLFHEQCVNLMILFERLDNAHYFHAITVCQVFVFLFVIYRIYELFVCVIIKNGKFSEKVV